MPDSELRKDYNNLTKGRMPGKRFSIFYVLISFIIIGVSIVFSINNIIVFGKELRANKDLRDKIEILKSRNSSLEYEINQLSSSERIRKDAFEKLGMVRNDSAIEKGKLIIIEKSKIR